MARVDQNSGTPAFAGATGEFGAVRQPPSSPRKLGPLRFAQHYSVGPCEGSNHWAAAHIDDVARLYRLALEKNVAARYHAVGEEGVQLRAISDIVSKGLQLPLRSITPDEAPGYFGWMTAIAGADARSSSDTTRAALGWQPTGPGLIADLEKLEWV